MPGLRAAPPRPRRSASSSDHLHAARGQRIRRAAAGEAAADDDNGEAAGRLTRRATLKRRRAEAREFRAPALGDLIDPRRDAVSGACCRAHARQDLTSLCGCGRDSGRSRAPLRAPGAVVSSPDPSGMPLSPLLATTRWHGTTMTVRPPLAYTFTAPYLVPTLPFQILSWAENPVRCARYRQVRQQSSRVPWASLRTEPHSRWLTMISIAF